MTTLHVYVYCALNYRYMLYFNSSTIIKRHITHRLWCTLTPAKAQSCRFFTAVRVGERSGGRQQPWWRARGDKGTRRSTTARGHSEDLQNHCWVSKLKSIRHTQQWKCLNQSSCLCVCAIHVVELPLLTLYVVLCFVMYLIISVSKSVIIILCLQAIWFL